MYQATPAYPGCQLLRLTEFQSSFLLKDALEIPVTWDRCRPGPPGGPPGTQGQPSLQRVRRRLKVCRGAYGGSFRVEAGAALVSEYVEVVIMGSFINLMAPDSKNIC
eukprot:s2934_g8.t1